MSKFLFQEFSKIDQALQHDGKIFAVHQDYGGATASKGGQALISKAFQREEQAQSVLQLPFDFLGERVERCSTLATLLPPCLQ